MNGKNWTQIKATVKLPCLETAAAIMSMVETNIQIEDYSDIDLKTCYGDLIDESILNADKTIAKVSVYLSEDEDVERALLFLCERFAAANIEAIIDTCDLSEEDWSDSWKAFYKPTRIGEHIVIVPMWEKYDPKPGDIIIKMDPGMAFGTGTHETTRLVIGLLEKIVKPGCRMLDVGCGSGILAICASKLGAKECKAYDIDPIAVKVANENIEASGQKNITCEVSDLLKQVDLSGGKYDVIAANIVADIIIRMAPDVAKYMNDDAVLLASGIISERADEVTAELVKNRLSVKERITDNGWCALVVKKD